MNTRHSLSTFAIILSMSFLTGCGSATPAPQRVPGGQTTPPKDGGGMGMMKPGTPPELTEEQKTQLATGTAPHAPTTVTFTVEGGSFYFVPNEIRVKKGDTVKIIFENKGGMHNFMLDEFNVKIDTIKTGESATAEFVADKTGSFEYYCGVGSHRQMGQKGTLIVE